MSFQPNMEEYADNGKFFYWMDYACEIDDICIANFEDDTGQKLIDHLNQVMYSKTSDKPEHHAAVDVASTLESLYPEYFKGVFVYV